MKLMGVLSLAVGIGFASSSLADVMDEYRDPKFTGGYIVGEFCLIKRLNRIRRPLRSIANMTCMRTSLFIRVRNMPS